MVHLDHLVGLDIGRRETAASPLNQPSRDMAASASGRWEAEV
jgi:hypothetical protein